MDFDQKVAAIKAWLGTGSINLFGLPLSGKDTQGVKLAETLGARFLSSGIIIRAMEEETGNHQTADGSLTPTNLFYKWVLPYFERRELWHTPLVLSSVGRWSGEETEVMNVATSSGHPIKAVVLLELPEQEIVQRWQTIQTLGHRDDGTTTPRPDDNSPTTLQHRLAEFRAKTLPVITHYQELGLLLTIPATGTREEVFTRLIDALYHFSQQNS